MKLLSFLFAATHFRVGVAALLQQSSLRRSTDSSSSSQPSRYSYTLFVKTRNHDVLDRVLQEAPRYKEPYLTKAQVRELSGLHDDDIKTFEAAVARDLGGKLVRVSALADSVTIEVGADVSHEDITRVLKDSTSVIPLEGGSDGRSSLHDHVVLIHQHQRQNVEISSSSSLMRSLEEVGTGLCQGGAGVNFYLIPYGFSREELVNYVGLLRGNTQFYVCCPNGEIEWVNNTCSSSASLTMTPYYPASQDETSTPEQVEIESLESIRRIIDDGSENDGVYVYTLPLDYFKPNVFYTNITLAVNTTDGDSIEPLTSFKPVILNIFNATSASIKRELFGVPDKYQGSADQVQFTNVGVIGNNAYNVSAVSEYLDLQGFTAYKSLEIFDWAPPNTPNECIPANSSDCSESMEEGMLDVDALQSMAPKATTKAAPGYVINPTDPDQNEDIISAWNLFFDKLLEADNPGVVSWSWSDPSLIQSLFKSFNETNPQVSFDENMVKAIEYAEEKLKKKATMGYTILVTSGDQGASGGGGGSGECIINTTVFDFINTTVTIDFGYLEGNWYDYWPKFSEWVTSVGGTQMLVLEEGAEAREVACSSKTGCGITSGGGFSGSFPALKAVYKRPSWQDEQVQEYLDNNGPETFLGFPDDSAVGYNPQGRAFPDIAAYANSYPTIDYDGSVSPASGTSLSAPLTAGLITLVNQALLEQGYKKVGYMNPMLYRLAKSCPEAFNDIISGDNADNQNDSNDNKCKYGFNAAPGWDPVTGLGSIKFESFVSCAIKYQTEQQAQATSTGHFLSLFTSVIWVTLSVVAMLILAE